MDAMNRWDVLAHGVDTPVTLPDSQVTDSPEVGKSFENAAADALSVGDWLDSLDPDATPSRSGEHMRRISAAVQDAAASEERLRDAVRRAREAGDSWTMIGIALGGVSRQAARERFRDG